MYNRVKKILLFLAILVIAAMLVQIFYIDNEARLLNEFSNNLYQYPLPPNTVVIEKTKFDGKNFIDGGGSGGYWNVGATIKLSTSLKKEDILRYYKNVKFPFPKSDILGVEPEIYFENDYKIEDRYYRNKMGRSNMVSSYFKENDKIKVINEVNGNNNSEYIFILQILSGYDYFLNLD